MSDTCIVCLGDLGGGASPSPVLAESVPRPGTNDNDDADGGNAIEHGSLLKRPSTVGVDVEEDLGQIARLLPCLHILHNNCLKPWVERANSCPICRQNFNVVEITDTVGGKLRRSFFVFDLYLTRL
jgi:hypothetical protein